MSLNIKNTLFAAAISGLMLGSYANAEEMPKKSASKTHKEGKKQDMAEKKVKCFGINACKGQSSCDVKGEHSCAGQNSCKGKGWIEVSLSECNSKGGKSLN